MNNRARKLASQALRFSIITFASLAIFYLGVLFSRGNEKGFPNLVEEQGINVLFGVIGGLITTAVITLLRPFYDSFRQLGKGDRWLSDVWDEAYIAEDYPEENQRQDLCFILKQRGDILSGTLIGTDPENLPPDQPRYGTRIFKIEGKVEGNIVSIDAILESDSTIGHTVYLLEINGDGSKLEGETLYYDITHKTIASAKSTLTRRNKQRRRARYG